MIELVLQCRGVLFDCDGVLVDSVASGERTWTRWAIEYGLSPGRVLEGVHGRRSADTVARYLPEAQQTEARGRIDALEIADAAGVLPIPGALDVLATLTDNWAVVTSASAPLLQARLAAAGIAGPRVVVAADDVAAGKPAPDGYLRAAEGLGLAIGECVVVEDSVTGILAGRAAGAGHVLGVGRHALATDASAVVKDLRGVRWSEGALLVPAESLLRKES